MKESTQTKIEIDVSLEDTPFFYCLVKSFFTGVLSLDQAQSSNGGEGSSDRLSEIDSLLDLLRVANRFLIEKRYPDCLALLEKVPRTVSNVCYLHSELEEYKHIAGVDALRQSLKSFVLDKFKDFDIQWQNDEFLNLPSSLLREILNNDNLVVTTEATVIQALRKWFNYNPKERVDDLVLLLTLVRFTQIEPTYLSEFLLPSTNFFNTKLKGIKKTIVESIKATFRGYVEAAMRFHLLPQKLKSDSSVSTSCLEGGMPANWQKKRVGYKSIETSARWSSRCGRKT